LGGIIIRLEQGVDLHIAQLMPLPLTVSCFSKVQIGFTSLVPAYLASPRQRADVKQMCVSDVHLPHLIHPHNVWYFGEVYQSSGNSK